MDSTVMVSSPLGSSMMQLQLCPTAKGGPQWCSLMVLDRYCLCQVSWWSNILPNIILYLSYNISLGSLSRAYTYFFVYLNSLILTESIFKKTLKEGHSIQLRSTRIHSPCQILLGRIHRQGLRMRKKRNLSSLRGHSQKRPGDLAGVVLQVMEQDGPYTREWLKREMQDQIKGWKRDSKITMEEDVQTESICGGHIQGVDHLVIMLL